MFGSTPRISFQNTVEGTWGQFVTPAGDVHFLLTKARLGQGSIDNERRLTSQLRPVREVLDPERLDFNQLLQRDLDDHRVATQLIPYLLKPDKTGPSFFPPIMTVLLPFNNAERPRESFPSVDFHEVIEDEQIRGLYWQEERASDAFRIRRMSNQQGDLHEIKLGQISWNEEAAKLVVLDGQHRAMALIAIDRTLNSSWDRNSGTRFRHFYEYRIQEILKTAENRGEKIELERIEIPVIVCWFPSESLAAQNPHGAARKLFVDVNKEARKPSEARLILLSDSELVNVFTRCLLNRLREDDPPLPLYSIEYDNPNDDANRPIRWSAMADLGILKRIIQFTVFCPSKYRKNMSQKFGGRLSDSEMDSRMREELDVSSAFPSVLDRENIERDSIGNTVFPRTEIDTLRHQFMKGWGTAILKVLGNLFPYYAHAKALQQLKEVWLTDDAISSLAFDAIFVGVGMYWTLRDSENYWKKQVERSRIEHLSIPPKPDIVKSWEIIDNKSKEFQAFRANLYLGKTNSEAVKEVNAAFDIMNTHACQLGVFLTLTALAEKVDAKMDKLIHLSNTLVEAWNASLRAGVNQSKTRLLVFDRNQNNSPNRIARLDPSLSIFFRYFWLELLCTKEAQVKLDDSNLIDAATSLCAQARRVYLAFLVGEQVKALKRSNPSWSKDKLQNEAQKIEVRELRKALKFWSFLNYEDFDKWFENCETQTSEEINQEDLIETEFSGNEDLDEVDASATSVEDLIDSFSEDD